jgi:GT2 family glycosyltransferase
MGPGEEQSDFGGCPVCVVIVNYKSAELAIDCLASLESELAAIPNARVALVENASGEGEVLAQALEDRGWSGWVDLIEAERNGGFAYGNNRAIEPALASPTPPRYILLLNPDTYIYPGAVSALLTFMDEHPEAGIAGSRLENPDGSVRRSVFRFPSLLSEFESGIALGPVSRLLSRWVTAPPVPEGDDPTPAEWLSGASMIIRREVFADIGSMDDGYFMYFEEVDFCRRAAQAGWSRWYVPQSRVVHLVGRSSGITDPRMRRKRRPRYWFDSRRRYFKTHLGTGNAVVADLLWVIGYSMKRLRDIVTNRPNDDPERLLSDFLSYNFSISRRVP